MSNNKKIIIYICCVIAIFICGFIAGYATLSNRIRNSGADGVSGIESELSELRYKNEQLTEANRRIEARNTELEQYADSLAGSFDRIGEIIDTTEVELDGHERTLESIGQSIGDIRLRLSTIGTVCNILKERNRITEEEYRKYKERERSSGEGD